MVDDSWSSYLKRLTAKALVYIGIISALEWVLLLYVDEAPEWSQSWLQRLDWLLPYSWALIILVCGYLLFREEVERQYQLKGLREDSAVLSAGQPGVTVGLNVAGKMSDRRQLSLPNLPEEPDFEALLSDERQRMEERLQTKKREMLAQDLQEILGYKELTFEQRIGEREEQQYMDRVKHYLAEFDAYLRECHQLEIYKRRTRPIGVIVQNVGRSSLDDVLVRLVIPEIVEVAMPNAIDSMLDTTLPDPPVEPELPPYPSIIGPQHLYVSRPKKSLPDVLFSSESRRALPNEPQVKHEESHTVVTYTLASLRPGFAMHDLKPVYLLFEAAEADIEVPVEVTVYSATLPEPMTTTLFLNVKVAASEDRSAA